MSPTEELRIAARFMDERTYCQEFQAEFANLAARRVYYAFERFSDVRSTAVDPDLPLFWS